MIFRISLLILFLKVGFPIEAQIIPQSPNAISPSGKREGKWTIWLSKNSKPTSKRDSVIYYRELTYRDGKPEGLVRDFYLNGKLRWEGYLVTDQPADILNGKSVWYDSEGNKTEEAQYNRVGKKISSTFFKVSDDMGDSLLSLKASGLVNLQQGNYFKALEYWEEGRAMAERKFGKQNKNYAIFVSYLSALYQTIGNYEKAEALILDVLHIYDGLQIQNQPEYAASLAMLAVLYETIGKYEKAEPILQQGLQKFKLPNQDRALALNNLAVLYVKMGRFDQAEPLLLEAMKSCRVSDLSPYYTAILNNLADLYIAKGQSYKVEKLVLKAVQLDKQLRGETPSYAISLANLGVFYSTIGQLTKAEQILLQSLQLLKDRLGENHPRYAEVLLYLGTLYKRVGRYTEAESRYLQGLQIVRAQFGDKSQDCVNYLEGLAHLNEEIGKQEKSEPYFLKANENLLGLLDRYFPSLSEKEKEEFYKMVRNSFEGFNSFAMDRYRLNRKITVEMFNVQLATKALLLNSVAKWKQRIRNSGDKKLASLYYSWEDQQAFLSKLYREPDPQKRKGIDSLLMISNALEKDLSQRSEIFALLADKKHYTWQDVQQKLQPNEAAIEIIRIQKYGVTKMVTDSSNESHPRYPKHGITDTVYYAALIVDINSKEPSMVILKNGNELEKQGINYYRNSINVQETDGLSYNQFWEPIGKSLGKKIKKIYLSPDGVYNSINLNTLYNPKTKHYLLEEKDIQLLTTSKDLLVAKKEEAYNNLAYLYGHPNYQATKEKRSTMVEKERSAQPVYYSLNVDRGSTLDDLPGTKTEVESIAGMLSVKGWQPTVLTEDNALEETLKDAFKPRVLHIATHGYFKPDSAMSNSNPLLQSGLMLTGAGRTLAGDKDEKTEDGILTAYEAMNLNLDNTDLVVLSACETGLGEIRNGQGVYGLQRAFKVAGARSIIMSLWKVNDTATQELVTLFYQFWLENGDKRDAFKKAQMRILANYPSPYYWGAFVMVGE